ncbi:MAG: class I SAM-dependent RNA methyltransferase [Lachnospiraceae bacterium]|nr:class I SAM-dependent RNA methyltransferase [Lachnospiraceae bacterium]
MQENVTKIAVPCHFGLEAVLKRELSDLGFDRVATEDGRVLFDGGIAEAALANVHLRSAERVMIECARFRAETYDELFEGIRAVPWEKWIPRNGRFWVRKASSIRSRLFSPSDIQSIVKKAMVEELKGRYRISWFPEDGPSYQFRVQIRNDEVSVCLDTSGESLHKRGYRVSPVIAPISETLAAGLLMLTPWKRGRILVDPCCGSGTFLIEAAWMAKRRAPGLTRPFLMETWENLGGERAVRMEKERAQSLILPSAESDLQGYDIDPRAAAFSRDNAKAAGVGGDIHFQARALADFSHPKHYGFLVSNPPYGERLENEKTLPELFRTFGRVYESLGDWSMYLISAYEDTELYVGKKAAKNRKIYNGMIETRFYQYPGPKPPKRPAGTEEASDGAAQEGRDAGYGQRG